jgi:DegV family protein with EDD domain
MSIAIVTDSTADIPTYLLREYEIHVMPNIIIIEGQEVEDGEQFSREEFYKRLPGMKSFPTTATASAGSYQKLYEKLFHNGCNQIISIHASSLLSGIFNAATTGAQAFGQRVHIIDSHQVSMGLGFQVLAAAEAVRQDWPIERILKHVEDVRRRAKVIAMIDTLEYIRRSGRVSWTRARLGNLLNIKPFVEVKEGVVRNLGEARTRRKGIERLIKMIQDLGPLERMAILHTNAEEDARHILSFFETKMAGIQPLIVNITTIVGTHVGPNGLGVAAVTQW